MRYFRGNDGKMHCSECGRVLAEIMPPMDEWTGGAIVATCECVKAKDRREKADMAKYMRFIRSKQTPAYQMLQNDSFTDWSFDKLDGTNPTALRMAQNYCENWQAKREKGAGLLFWGGVGTGKTVLTACIVNELMKRRVSCLMTTTVKLVEKLMPGAYEGDLIGQLKWFDLLVLDDWGAESKSTYAQQQVFNIINQRIESGLPMILTTNTDAKALSKPENIQDARIFDRIQSVCVSVRFDGKSHRQAQRDENVRLAMAELRG